MYTLPCAHLYYSTVSLFPGGTRKAPFLNLDRAHRTLLKVMYKNHADIRHSNSVLTLGYLPLFTYSWVLTFIVNSFPSKNLIFRKIVCPTL